MNADCMPITALPHISALFRDYISGSATPEAGKLQSFYSPYRANDEWLQHSPSLSAAVRSAIVSLLREQNRTFGAGPATEANLDRLAEGAAAVVTGQQVGLFGGPLLTLLKAATAIRLAEDASRAGHPHVPIFWLASEDHDFAEVNQATFPVVVPGNDKIEKIDKLVTLRLPPPSTAGSPVGDLRLGSAILPLLDELHRCLGDNVTFDLLASRYTPDATFASAFGGFLAQVFSRHGLIVIDAAARPFHALARPTLQAAIEQAEPLRTALIERSKTLEAAGYHAQVLVAPSSSLLFLLDEESRTRNALKTTDGHSWSAGPHSYTTKDLLAILDAAPERLSPNALLRPIMQDTILPTSAYVGGPAEIAYFAQADVAYREILHRTTPILPRFSATLLEPDIARLLERHHLSLPDVFCTPEELVQRLGARALPIEGKRKLAAAGNSLDRELTALTEWMRALDTGLGHSGEIAASKMRYQMNRMRRLAANFQSHRERNLHSHAELLSNRLFPHQQPQERVLAGAWFLSRSPDRLPDLLVEHANSNCRGHQLLEL